MVGRGLRALGMMGSMRFMASDDGRGRNLPPLPIVDDQTVMMRELAREHERVVRKESSSCMILVRPDDLPAGTAGEQISRAIGTRYSHNLRPYDSLYRFSDDMYLIVLSHIKPEDVRVVMKRLCDVVGSEMVSLEDNSVVPATVSLGGAMVDGSVSLKENLEYAGQALHAASRNGGNDVCVFMQGDVPKME